MTSVLEVEGVLFSHRLDSTSTPGHFHIHKRGSTLDRYRNEVVATMGGCNVVELGIFQGGSTALAALEGKPRRIVAIDIGEPVAALHALDAPGLVLHHGVDQADRAAVARIVADEFGDDPLDLVVDDASHIYGPTVASFEVLFPRLRPGGRYLIEDWDWELCYVRGFEALVAADPTKAKAMLAEVGATHPLHQAAAALLAETPDLDGFAPFPSTRDPAWRPLASIASDLVAAQSDRPDAVASVTIEGPWIAVERGPAELPTPCGLAALTGWSRHIM